MDKLAICYTCCGPTYRKTARDKLINLHEDNEDIFYFVITEDVDYFKDIQRKNLIVKNLKDFYDEYPHIKEYEYFLESESVEDYGKKFIETNYRFPFSVNRFNLLLAKEYGIKNIALLGTDTDIFIDVYKTLKPKQPNTIYSNSRWYETIDNQNMMIIVEALKSKFNLNVSNEVMAFDAAGKLFCFDSTDYMIKFFEIWDYIIKYIYDTNNIHLFQGSYAVNNEFILAPIYNALSIVGPVGDVNLFYPQHNPEEERFWL
jgi:hypothetical protein